MFRNQNWARRDAEACATPLFPVRPLGGRGVGAYYTHPPASRYDAVLTVEQAIECVIAQADLIEASGGRWLLVEMTPPLARFLVAHGADREDFEDGVDDEADLGV